MSQHFTDASFESEVLKSSIPVLVDFFAIWCGPCRMMGPIIDSLADEYKGRVKIGKMDVDENPETAQKFGIQSIPTIILFKNGKEMETIAGVKSQDVLAEKLDALL